MGFSRQEYWSGLPFPSPGDLPNPGIEPRSPALQADTLTSEPPGKPLVVYAAATAAKSLQSCPTLCDPMDCSLPGFSIHGILQARTLEWVTISFSNAWKWKVKVKLLSCVWLLATPWTAVYQAPPSMGFSGNSTGVECHCLLCLGSLLTTYFLVIYAFLNLQVHLKDHEPFLFDPKYTK